MSERTGIEWCDATFNPWWGCQKVSPACDHCYAERDAARFAPGRVLWGVGSERRTFDDKHWQQPARWAKRAFVQCGACGWRGMHTQLRHDGGAHFCPSCGNDEWRPARMRVFCASMADWLDLDAPLDEFVRLLDTIRLTPEIDWLLLTKRIGNWRNRLTAARDAIGTRPEAPALWDWISAWLAGDFPPAHCWLGATVVNQEEADRDIPKLLATPARVRFLSIEPMLGPITLPRFVNLPSVVRGDFPIGHRAVAEAGLRRVERNKHGARSVRAGDGTWLGIKPDECEDIDVDWVIAGGESGPHARPAHPDWFRSLRDQCAAAGVPFFFKQWGEWWEAESDSRDDETGAHHVIDVPGIEASERFDPQTDCLVAPNGRAFASLDDLPEGLPCRHMIRLGKKAAGRLLDGSTHDEFPSRG